MIKGSPSTSVEIAWNPRLPHICYVYECILAQTVHSVNGYMLDNYGLATVALMHAVRYSRNAPV